MIVFLLANNGNTCWEAQDSQLEEKARGEKKQRGYRAPLKVRGKLRIALMCWQA